MIRPELKSEIWRWREVILGLTVAALLAWAALSMFGFMRYLVALPVLFALAFCFSAFQRVRFAQSHEGLGLVEMDEGVISYLAAAGGGQVELANLTSICLVPEDAGKASWQLDSLGQPTLRIPTDAHNVEVLFDAFVTLPGLQTEKMLSQIKRTPDQPVVIWKKRTAALH